MTFKPRTQTSLGENRICDVREMAPIVERVQQHCVLWADSRALREMLDFEHRSLARVVVVDITVGNVLRLLDSTWSRFFL